MKFGYARVSTQEQSLKIQVNKLLEAGCDEVYQEKASGAKDDRKVLLELIRQLRRGDTVCVVRIDRLGRRMIQLATMINDFKEKGIHFIALENNIDTTTPMGMLLFSMCAAFSEMERELICERVRVGVKAAQAKGAKFGRHPVLTPRKKQMLDSCLLNPMLSVPQICEMVGISKTTYYRIKHKKED